MVVSPFVFAMRGEPELSPNREVAEVVWAPLGPLEAGEARASIDYPFEGSVITLPGYRVGGHVVWGLTYQMLQVLFEALQRPRT